MFSRDDSLHYSLLSPLSRYLRDTLHFVDKRRVAVWGWSYGGFVAALSLAKSSDIFHCGISVAPVTNWALYGILISLIAFKKKLGRFCLSLLFSDSAYTERYMGFPNITDNYKGYEEADVTKWAERLKNKMFYLIHGTADDNVHFHQSMALVKALTSR